VAIPAGVVAAMVGVVVLFGSLAGQERTPSENLSLVVHGGAGERHRALIGLTRQAVANQRAADAGAPLPWPLEEGFRERLLAAVAQVGEEEPAIRLALAALLANLEEPRGVEILIELLGLEDGQDGDRRLRFMAIENLGLIADPRAARPLIPFLDHDDEGLRSVTAISLGSFPGEEVRSALEGALLDSSLEVRANAALSLSRREPPDPVAADVLADLTDAGAYATVHREDPGKFASAADVSRFRVMALKALARLDRPADWAHIETLRGDSDPNVVDAALRLIASREEQP